MKKAIQLVCLLLVFSIVMSLFVGCSEDNSKDTADKVEKQEDIHKDDGDKDEQEDEGELPDVYYEAFPLVEYPGQKTSEEVIKEVQDYIADQCGVIPVPVTLPRGSEEEKKNLLISSADERFDMFRGDWHAYADKGLLMPLNDLIEEHGPNITKLWDEYDYMWDKVTDEDGTIWALPIPLPLTSYPTWIRVDWLEECGLEMPETIDEFEQILKAFKEKDPAGNNKTIPLLTDMGGLNHGLSAGFTEYGCGNWKDENGKINPYITQPGFKDAVAKMAEWYKEGYIYKESYVTNRDQEEELLFANRVGSTIKWYSLIAANAEKIEEKFPGAEYEFCDKLEGPKGSVETLGKPGSHGVVILKKAENPEAAIKFMDWMMESVGNFLVPRYGIEGKDWEFVDKENGLIKEIGDKRYFGDFYFYNANPLLRQYGLTSDDGKLTKMNEFMMNHQYRYDTVKEPFDKLTTYPSDELDELAPNRGDVDRMIEEELVKFLTCLRPMSEWDDFIEDLYEAGLDQLIDAYTDIYNKEIEE